MVAKTGVALPSGGRSKLLRALFLPLALAVVPSVFPGIARAAATTVQAPLTTALETSAPRANPRVLALAARAVRCVRQRMPVRTLSVIDYSLPSTQRRLWVFDLASRKLLFREWVAHGRNTGGNLAEHFSNRPGSHMSSLGTFVTDGTYSGHNGYSLRLKGIDGRFNNEAEARAIVIHGASYVSRAFAHEEGRMGRSYGCPAVRRKVAHQLIDAIRKQSVVFAYYPDRDWLNHSRVLNDCGSEGGGTLADRDRRQAQAPQSP